MSYRATVKNGQVVLQPAIQLAEGTELIVSTLEEMSAVQGQRFGRDKSPLAVHPELRAVHVAPDAFAPADEQDWPEECR